MPAWTPPQTHSVWCVKLTSDPGIHVGLVIHTKSYSLRLGKPQATGSSSKMQVWLCSCCFIEVKYLNLFVNSEATAWCLFDGLKCAFTVAGLTKEWIRKGYYHHGDPQHFSLIAAKQFTHWGKNISSWHVENANWTDLMTSSSAAGDCDITC